MLFEPIEDHVPSEFLVKLALDPWELRDAMRLRKAVFCHEQGIFSGDDRDAIDDSAITLVAISCIAGVPDQVVGTVRIHEEKSGVWYGSRLAVHASFRRVSHIGASLIRLAVGSAHARGCGTFLAHVQSQNARMFERLHWRTLMEVQLHGRPHHFMQADLAHYPPLHEGATGFMVAGGKVAA
ncbi:MAG: GNAT family N-acetyltransferase [Betaproteobacteria bacterium]|nr:GNAT family N-acetyltransferase [Betaproteobacteria bacterium]